MKALVTLTLLLGVSDLHYRDLVGKFNGVWRITRFDFRGVDLLAFMNPGLAKERFRFDGDKVYMNNEKEPGFTFFIPRDAEGRAIDIGATGPHQPVKGIYSLKDGLLQIAFFYHENQPGHKRPKSFAPGQADLVIVVFKRIH
jgi:uncharacterized protein (TIGR03067 family)